MYVSFSISLNRRQGEVTLVTFVFFYKTSVVAALIQAYYLSWCPCLDREEGRGTLPRLPLTPASGRGGPLGPPLGLDPAGTLEAIWGGSRSWFSKQWRKRMLTQSSVSMFDPRAWKRTTQRYFLWLCTLRLVYDDVLAPQAPCAFFIMLLGMHLFEVRSAFKEKMTEYWIDFFFFRRSWFILLVPLLQF